MLRWSSLSFRMECLVARYSDVGRAEEEGVAAGTCVEGSHGMENPSSGVSSSLPLFFSPFFLRPTPRPQRLDEEEEASALGPVPDSKPRRRCCRELYAGRVERKTFSHTR